MRWKTVPDSRSSSTKGGEPNDKLDRVTDKTLAEAERKALHGLCR